MHISTRVLIYMSMALALAGAAHAQDCNYCPASTCSDGSYPVCVGGNWVCPDPGGGGDDGGCGFGSGGSCSDDWDCSSWDCEDGCCNDTWTEVVTSCISSWDCPTGQSCNGGACQSSSGTPVCSESYSSGGFYCIDQNGAIQNTCDSDGCNSDCSCADYEDPILIDLSGNGYLLTDAANGTKFDILANKRQVQMGWTQRSANIGFLVIDRNGNSQIGDGSELFSNISPQNGVMAQRNGFRALAVYDQPSHGGNKDGIIDSRDPIYSKLRVWVDKNHNGHSEPDELMTFDQAGIKSISVHYKPNHWKDAYGNEFRYSSTIRFVNGRSMEIYDVFLVSIPNSKNAAN